MSSQKGAQGRVCLRESVRQDGTKAIYMQNMQNSCSKLHQIPQFLMHMSVDILTNRLPTPNLTIFAESKSLDE